MSESPKAQALMHLAQAATRAENADAQAHIEAALGEIEELPWPEQIECPNCGRKGLVGQIAVHECG